MMRQAARAIPVKQKCAPGVVPPVCYRGVNYVCEPNRMKPAPLRENAGPD